MPAQEHALVEEFDAVYMIANDFQAVHNTVVPIDLFADSKRVFDAVTKGLETAEKRLLIDVLATRNTYQRFKIGAIGLVSGENVGQ